MSVTADDHGTRLTESAAAEIAQAAVDCGDYVTGVHTVAMAWRDRGKDLGWPVESQVAAFAFVTSVGADIVATFHRANSA